ncbi:hypothetical protein OUZ56_004260 [Daphnia magna]|uniref:Uncharacterized protein n=1 Tax=Daphnia magna TaxID=35525 RepID=A0ABQ9YP74_9CRUS|nr:hypothetical protein OUZ56_004260 [Daphnia magna]
MDDQPMQGLCSGGTVRERKERGCSKPHNDRHNLHKISNTKFQNKRVEEVFFFLNEKQNLLCKTYLHNVQRCVSELENQIDIVRSLPRVCPDGSWIRTRQLRPFDQQPIVTTSHVKQTILRAHRVPPVDHRVSSPANFSCDTTTITGRIHPQRTSIGPLEQLNGK